MNFIQQLIPDQIINALGWTVVHSIWQGLVMATALYFLLQFFKNKSAQWKYLLANFFLLGLFGMAIGTFFFLYEQAEPLVIQQADRLIWVYQPLEWSQPALSESHALFTPIDQLFSFLNDHISLITAVWMIGLLFFGMRMAGGMLYVQHLKIGARLHDADHWQHMLDDMADRLKISYPVFLLESSRVVMPMTIGFIKPIILFPVGMVNRLPLEQVEAILAHELAHIHRYDYLSNLIQSFIETLLYFNPAVWWISSIIRKERENRCDDMAIELCGSSLTYAKALVSLQDHHEPTPLLAMTLSKNKNVLLKRIRRILNQPQQNSSTMEKFIVSCLLLSFVFIFSLGAQQPQAEVKEPERALFFPEPTQEPDELFFSEAERPVFPEPDTLLPKGKMTLKVTENDSTIDVQVENGKINYLIINGRTIPKSDFPKYEKYIEDIIRDIPEPPAPPAPPYPVGPGPNPKAPPAPPAPPAPAPWGFKSSKGTRITTEKDAAGNTIIYMDEGNFDQPLEVILHDGDKVIINGDTILPGESTVIYGDNAFSFDGNDFFFKMDSRGMDPSIFFHQNDKESYQKLLDQAQRYSEQSEQWSEKKRHNLKNLWEQMDKTRELQWREMKKGQHKMKEQIENLQREHQKARELMDKELFFQESEQWRNLHELDSLHNYYNIERPGLLHFSPDGPFGIHRPSLDIGIFEEALIKDGLVKEGEKYRMELNNQSLKVNGNKCSNDLHKKYLKLAKEIAGEDIKEDGYNLSIEKKARAGSRRTN